MVILKIILLLISLKANETDNKFLVTCVFLNLGYNFNSWGHHSFCYKHFPKVSQCVFIYVHDSICMLND